MIPYGTDYPEAQQDLPDPRPAVDDPVEGAVVPGSHPRGAEPGTTTGRPTYCDIAALLDGGLPDPPAPNMLARSEAVCLFYSGQVNLLFGDPESGKTFVALAWS